MLRIAVIDDDKTLLCDMHKLFDRFIIAYDFDFTVEYFSSCEDIYAKFKAGEKYDLLFLDIEFPEMKGTEFGLQLRRQMKNYDTQIVFISTIRDYAMELFKIRPIAFLIKPIAYEDLCKCLQDYMLDYSNSDSFLEYISENTKQFLHFCGGVASIQLLNLCCGRPSKCSMRAENFPLSACGMAMQIENIRCWFHQLSGNACQQ